MPRVARLWLITGLVLGLMATSTQTKLRHKSDDSTRHGRRASLRVTTILAEPYLMLNEQHANSSDTRLKYHGYISDLLHQLSNIVGFSYDIHVVGDGLYGHRRRDGWTGMVGELLRYKADLAAAPLLITAQRAAAVDFSVPYMHLHATVLLRKPPSGSELAITSSADLINQSEIKYGTMASGLIKNAFLATNDTVAKVMWRTIERARPSVLTNTNEEGIERVRTEKYGFILPSTIAEYVKYMQPCDLVTIDSFLLDRGYGLAMRKDSRLLPDINRGLAEMESKGQLAELKAKWWYEHSPCKAAKARRMYSVGQSALPPSGSRGTLLAGLLMALLLTQSRSGDVIADLGMTT